MKETHVIRRPVIASSILGRLLKPVIVLCMIAFLCFPHLASGRSESVSEMPVIASGRYLASKFSFLDDILSGFNKSGGKYVGPTHRYSQQEERRGERGFFYYVFQFVLRLVSGCFLAFHAGMLVGKISRKNNGSDTAVAIGGFVFSMIFPWIAFIVGGACWGLSKLSDDSAKNSPGTGR